MIFHKVQKGIDWLLLSILDNTCTRKFCKSNGYWEYVNSVKQIYNKLMWFSENKKKPPVKILSMADTGIILFRRLFTTIPLTRGSQVCKLCSIPFLGG